MVLGCVIQSWNFLFVFLHPVSLAISELALNDVGAGRAPLAKRKWGKQGEGMGKMGPEVTKKGRDLQEPHTGVAEVTSLTGTVLASVPETVRVPGHWNFSNQQKCHHHRELLFQIPGNLSKQ